VERLADLQDSTRTLLLMLSPVPMTEVRYVGINDGVYLLGLGMAAQHFGVPGCERNSSSGEESYVVPEIGGIICS
jgi:hypothetical protein